MLLTMGVFKGNLLARYPIQSVIYQILDSYDADKLGGLPIRINPEEIQI